MALSRTKISHKNKHDSKTRKYYKSQQNRKRRRQEKSNIEDPPKRNQYRGWSD